MGPGFWALRPAVSCGCRCLCGGALMKLTLRALKKLQAVWLCCYRNGCSCRVREAGQGHAGRKGGDGHVEDEGSIQKEQGSPPQPGSPSPGQRREVSERSPSPAQLSCPCSCFTDKALRQREVSSCPLFSKFTQVPEKEGKSPS